MKIEFIIGTVSSKGNYIITKTNDRCLGILSLDSIERITLIDNKIVRTKKLWKPKITVVKQKNTLFTFSILIHELLHLLSFRLISEDECWFDKLVDKYL